MGLIELISKIIFDDIQMVSIAFLKYNYSMVIVVKNGKFIKRYNNFTIDL